MESPSSFRSTAFRSPSRRISLFEAFSPKQTQATNEAMDISSDNNSDSGEPLPGWERRRASRVAHKYELLKADFTEAQEINNKLKQELINSKHSAEEAQKQHEQEVKEISERLKKVEKERDISRLAMSKILMSRATLQDSYNDLQVSRDKLLQVESQVRALADCAICKCPITRPAAIQCGHIFCRECVSEWFEHLSNDAKPRTCPTCRERIRTRPTMKLIGFSDLFRSVS